MSDPKVTESLPPLAFLGLCERSSYVREGNTNLFKWNVLGLKTVILSYIFPLKIEGWSAGFAFVATTADEEAKLRLVNEHGREIGTLNLFAQAISPTSEDMSLRKNGPLLLVPQHGTTTVFVQLGDTGWVIPAPGIYYLEQILQESFVRIGTLQFASVDAPPLTADRIAAIKSEVNATKAVRLELGCKYCPSKCRVYAALERSEDMERDGWAWYQGVSERFDCECGKTEMALIYIRRNLHGLLGHRPRSSSDLSITPLYEHSSLVSIRSSFVQLINTEPKEELIQEFLQENPILLHQIPAEQLLSKPSILTNYVADFAIVTPQRELVLIELEKSSIRLMRKGGDIAAPLSHAFDQVRNWLHVVDEHRLAVLDSLNIAREAVSTVRGVVIAGRDIGYDALELRKLKGVDFGRISFLTYDDVIFSLDALIRQVESI